MKFSCVLSTLFIAVTAVAAEPPPSEFSGDVPAVVITGTPSAAIWAYSSLLAGVRAFEEHRDMAPSAALRFRLRAHSPTTRFEGIALDLLDGNTSVPIPLAEDGGFVLAPAEPEPGANAEVVASRNKGQFDANRLPRAEVLSSGVPQDQRRLGDLRLECEVEMAVAKKTLGFANTLGLNALVGINWCNPRKPKGFVVQTGRLIDHVVMIDGARRATIAPGKTRTTFMAPIYDSTWPNDTLLEIHYSEAK